MSDAFGVVALVALTPLIAVQIMGMQYQYILKQKEKAQQIPKQASVAASYEFFDFEEDDGDVDE